MSSHSSISVFAPATVANVGSAYDVLGLALESPGDVVTARLTEVPGISISSIEGDGGVLPIDPERNTATVSIAALLARLYRDRNAPGMEIAIRKGLPIGSGLGSSSASTVAAVVAANELLGSPFSRIELLPFAMEGERIACGSAHADNVAPALLGGFALIRSYDPLDVIPLPSPSSIIFTLVTPDVEVKTSDARRILRSSISLTDAVAQWGNVAALIAAIFKDNPDLFGKALHDRVIEPARADLIPGFHELRRAALHAGALGFAISGSGPTMFAVSSSQPNAMAIGDALREQLSALGIQGRTHVSGVNQMGATVIERHDK